MINMEARFPYMRINSEKNVQLEAVRLEREKD
jgi:hypothetical protein